MLMMLLLLWFSDETPTRTAAPPSDLTVSALHGETIARQNCASCHAIGLTDTSPLPRAPAFRDLADRYPVENLEEALAEGIYVGHDSPMPPFRLEAGEIADLTAYLRKLRDERSPRR